MKNTFSESYFKTPIEQTDGDTHFAGIADVIRTSNVAVLIGKTSEINLNHSHMARELDLPFFAFFAELDGITMDGIVIMSYNDSGRLCGIVNKIPEDQVIASYYKSQFDDLTLGAILNTMVPGGLKLTHLGVMKTFNSLMYADKLNDQ